MSKSIEPHVTQGWCAGCAKIMDYREHVAEVMQILETARAIDPISRLMRWCTKRAASRVAERHIRQIVAAHFDRN